MQNSSQNDDNDSIHSDESNISFSAVKEKLDNLINMELKHSGVYRDIYFKDNLLNVDLENLCNTCQRLDIQIKKKSEQLDDMYDKLSDDQKQLTAKLSKELLVTLQKIAEINSSFCEAFDIYSYDVSKDTHEYFKNQTNRVNEDNLGLSKDLFVTLQREGINGFIIKTQFTQILDMKNAVDMLFEMTMKQPEFELGEANKKLTEDIQRFQQLV